MIFLVLVLLKQGLYAFMVNYCFSDVLDFQSGKSYGVSKWNRKQSNNKLKKIKDKKVAETKKKQDQECEQAKLVHAQQKRQKKDAKKGSRGLKTNEKLNSQVGWKDTFSFVFAGTYMKYSLIFKEWAAFVSQEHIMEKVHYYKDKFVEFNDKHLNEKGVLELKTTLTEIFWKHYASIKKLFGEFGFLNTDYSELYVLLEKNAILIQNCELLDEFFVILRILVSYGWLPKLELIIGGVNLVNGDPFRKKVPITELIGHCNDFAKLLWNKCLLVLKEKDITLLWLDPLKSDYDDEYSYLLAQKTRIDLGRAADITDVAFDRRVSECVTTTLGYLNSCKDGERAYYSSRLSKLREVETSRVLSKKEHIRIKPYGMLLNGPSGVGKSAIVNSLLRYILRVNGKDYSPRAVVTLNQQDKFQSEFATHHKGVILDDLCNTNESKQEGSPVESIIMFLNQIPMAALNPNAEMKGKVMIEPDVVCGTTNVKDLLSNIYSNEPLSINRRFEVTITQTVAPEYRLGNTEMLDTDAVSHMSNDVFPAFARFTVERPQYPVGESYSAKKSKSGKTRTIQFVPIVFEEEELIDIDIHTLLEFLKYDSRNHFAKQQKFVDGQKARSNMELCECCEIPVTMCTRIEPTEGWCDCCGLPEPTCPYDEILDEQFGISDLTNIAEWYYDFEEKLCILLHNILHDLCKSKLGYKFITWYFSHLLNKLCYYATIFNSLLALYIMYAVQDVSSIILFVSLYLIGLYTIYVYITEIYAKKRVLVKLRSLKPSVLYSKLSVRHKTLFVGFLVGIGLWKILRNLAKKYFALPIAQAALPLTSLPKDMKNYQKENEFWDTNARERQYQFGDAGVTDRAKTGTHVEMIRRISPRLVTLSKENGEFVSGLLLKSNVVLIPNHFVSKHTQFVRFEYTSGMIIKEVPLSHYNTCRVGKTDLAVWYVPAVGPQRDLMDYYPLNITDEKKLDVYMLRNHNNKIVQTGHMTAVRGNVVTSSGGIFKGLHYTYPTETEGGMCMSVLIGDAKGTPFIAGHHVAGKGTHGAAAFVTRNEIEAACVDLDQRPGVLLSHSAKPFDTTIADIDVGPLTTPNFKCATRDLPKDSKIIIHGEHNQPRSSPSSAVVTSVISKAVKEVMNIDKMHGKPIDMSGRDHKVVDILKKTTTASRFETPLVQAAYSDMRRRVFKGLTKSELAKIGKVSIDVNLAGLDGVLGINSMNFQTALGFPWRGPKHKKVQKSDRVVPGITCPRDCDEDILEQVEEVKARLLAGESINSVFKGSLKDEPTKLGKKKVRVFAAANIVMIILCREYFLSLAAFMQRNKNLTECAVGTVVQSPEWTELFEHIGKYGWDRAIAGDYASFDGRMSAEFMLAAFKLMIEIAKESGNYDEEDLMIMRGIASEISYPTYDFFGTLVQFFGSNPSGHPLTVVINSLVNSLYMRYVYYKIARDDGWWKTPDFDQVVSLMTYGDDNIMTVKKGFDAYNHTRIAHEFELVGITYTMADKEAASIPFIDLKDASFLKHFAVWDDDLGLYRSVIEESSIAKMLHTHLRSKVLTMEQSSAEAIQNVALKYFEFGEGVYKERISQLKEVAEVAGISGYLGQLKTYGEMRDWYKQKFELD